MATPDPHMHELALISYEPRSRQCKDLYRVPCKGDYIEVLWCLDDQPGMPNRWCSAEVLHISGPPERETLAKGVIRYLPSENWGEQFHFVDFLDTQKLRCSVEEEASQLGELDGTDNDNPNLSWRFSSESTKPSDAQSDDESWCADHSAIDAGLHEKGFRGCSHNSRSSAKSLQSGCNNEIKALRNGHAALTIEMEKLKRELVRVYHFVESTRSSGDIYFQCTSSSCVMPRLRQKLALRMQKSLNQAPARLGKRKRDDLDQDPVTGYGDGFQPGVIKVRVECTLKQFESLSLEIRASTIPSSVFFSPDFSYTQLPLQCSAEFSIFFQTFSQLCDSIGITSSSDKKEMARKCGAASRGELLRILGTYCFDEKIDRHPAIFFPGTSCGNLNPETVNKHGEHSEQVNSGENKADPLIPVLVRKTREWNLVDSRFRHGLKREEISLPKMEVQCNDKKAFALVWNRETDLGGKAWSETLCNSKAVFGWLEVQLPFVQTQGKLHCQELGGHAHDELWDLLLCKQIT